MNSKIKKKNNKLKQTQQATSSHQNDNNKDILLLHLSDVNNIFTQFGQKVKSHIWFFSFFNLTSSSSTSFIGFSFKMYAKHDQVLPCLLRLCFPKTLNVSHFDHCDSLLAFLGASSLNP